MSASSRELRPPLLLDAVITRMGFAFANEAIIQYMNNVKAPYNVNRLSQEVAFRALSDRTLFQDQVNAILQVCSCFFSQGRQA